MNTNMWMHPFTNKHLAVLQDTFEFKVVAPISKTLACGDTGKDHSLHSTEQSLIALYRGGCHG